MPPAPARFDTIAQRESGLNRTLSSGQISMIAIGGAIGTGLFLGSGFAISFAGPSVLLSYAISAFIALLLMGCLAEMTVAHPTSGSFGAYAEYYISPLAGFLVRYAYWFAIVGAVGTEVTAVAVYMRFWYPAVPGWLWILLFSAALVGINAVNVSVFGKVEYSFSMLKIVVIIAFILLGAAVVFLAPTAGENRLSQLHRARRIFPQRRLGHVGRGHRIHLQLSQHRNDRRRRRRSPRTPNRHHARLPRHRFPPHPLLSADTRLGARHRSLERHHHRSQPPS